MISISVIFILFFLAVSDIKRQKVSVFMLVAAGIAAVVFRIIFTMIKWMEFSVVGIIAAMVPGIVFLILSYVTREQIGYGDGIVLCIMGILCPFWKLMMILGIGLGISSFVSIILLILRKGSRYTKIPFLPFLWIGTVVEMFLEGSRL